MATSFQCVVKKSVFLPFAVIISELRHDLVPIKCLTHGDEHTYYFDSKEKRDDFAMAMSVRNLEVVALRED